MQNYNKILNKSNKMIYFTYIADNSPDITTDLQESIENDI